MKTTSEDKRLIDYLLGNLPEPDQIHLEEEYLANPDAQERLLVIEDELVDAYLQGQLSARERKQLEAGFLASLRGRRKLDLARSLMKVASEQKPAPKPKSLPAFSIRWALAAASVILVVALIWSVKEKAWQHRGAERAESPQNQANKQAPIAQPTQTHLPSESPSEHSQFPVVASIILKPIGRNAEQSPRIRISHDALQVRIQLDLEADNHKSYKVSLLGAGDDVRWSSRGLKSQTTASGRAIVLTLPVKFFENGEHTFLLSPDEDIAGPIAEYVFVVLKK